MANSKTVIGSSGSNLTNEATLEKIGESGGQPTWNGGVWPSGGGGSYSEVEYFADLPVTVGDPIVGSLYVVQKASGVWLINRRAAGIYRRIANNGVSADWERLGDWVEIAKDANLVLVDDADNTKKLQWQLSVLGTGVTRTINPPGSDGVLLVEADIADLQPVEYAPGTLTVDYGTLSAGAVGDLAAVGGTDVDITEAAAANALQVQFDWTGVARMQDLTLFGNYAGGAGHVIIAEAYNWNATAWETIGSISYTASKQWYSFPLFNAAAYIDSGAVRMRLRHDDNGVAAHHLYLDKVALVYGGQSGATSVGASSVSFVPVGNIVSTNVQEAIEELDDEKLGTTEQAADVDPAGTAIASALSGKLGTSETAADVNPSGTSIASALGGKLGTTETAADVNPAGTSIAAALSGKLGTSETAADVNPAGTNIAAALGGKASTSQKLDDFGAPDDNTDLDASTSAHGLLPKLPNTEAVLTGKGFASRVVAGVSTLTDGATIATDASLGNLFRVTLGGNRTLSNPTNGTDGQRITWEIIQDGTGSRTLSLDTAFALGTDIDAVTLTTTASKRDFLVAVYNSTSAKWYVVGFLKGY